MNWYYTNQKDQQLPQRLNERITNRLSFLENNMAQYELNSAKKMIDTWQVVYEPKQ